MNNPIYELPKSNIDMANKKKTIRNRLNPAKMLPTNERVL